MKQNTHYQYLAQPDPDTNSTNWADINDDMLPQSDNNFDSLFLSNIYPPRGNGKGDVVFTTSIDSYSKEQQSIVEMLPQHMRCMLPPPGVLSTEELERTTMLILEYQDVFVGADGRVGYTDQISHKIDTGEAVPIKDRLRKSSYVEREKITQEVTKMLAEGQISPSSSPWGAGVVLVEKKDGAVRFCIDYRRLNQVTKKDAYPLPKIEECLDRLLGNKYFHVVDCCSGYWQVKVHPEDKEKTAFITPIGLFEWEVMPFGLCNAPATFCRLMEKVLSDICWSRCLVYLDDIVSFGKDFAEALLNLGLVLERLRRSNMKLKPKKCELFRTRVEYLGHEVSDKGIKPSSKKVEVLQNWPVPTNQTEVRTFLGFCSYYRRFIESFAAIAKPLYDLTCKGIKVPVPLKESQLAAFCTLRDSLCQRVMMHYVVPGHPFILDTDASGESVGACLSQRIDEEERPLAFASKILNKTRRSYCTTKRELYAVVYFMRYFQGYIRFSDVFIRTDHSCLRWLTTFRGADTRGHTDPMYFRWITELDSHRGWTTISYREGKLHQNADSMSRINPHVPRHETVYGPARRDCGFAECTQCSIQFRDHRKILKDVYSSSEDDDTPYPPPGNDRGGPSPRGKESKDDGPDEGDYMLHMLVAMRQQHQQLLDGNSTYQFPKEIGVHLSQKGKMHTKQGKPGTHIQSGSILITERSSPSPVGKEMGMRGRCGLRERGRLTKPSRFGFDDGNKENQDLFPSRRIKKVSKP
ncbi:MAG: hypothetical protein GY702_04500, partial [Desulfobulbaceae bacterium]|nr:hypothetical protein [Desulfobulbaceae bacterium]